MLANDFIFGGILDRFPQLKVICSEFELSWVPGFMARLDQTEAVAPRLKIPRLKMKVTTTCASASGMGSSTTPQPAFASHTLAPAGCCGSDFPHVRSIGLDADSAVYGLIAALPAHEQEMVVGGNAAEVFTCSGDEPGRTSTRGRLPFFCWYAH